ncbi:MAG: S8 family serine peptidase [Bacteroidales bacterium]|nr:S8 family serine peptidase [Bacteroidales bacterium]
MKRISLLMIVAFIFISTNLFSQREVSPNHYCIYFKDKVGTPYSINKPQQFLSQKAIDRRTKYGIKVNNQDLPVNPQYVKQIKELGFEILNTSKWLNCVIVYTKDKTLLEKVKNLPFVAEDLIKYPKKDNIQTVKNDDFQKIEVKKEKLDKVYKYGKGKNQIKMLNGDYLHKKGYKGKGMTIAVLDGGFYHVNTLPAFDSLWANNQILGWYDFVDCDTTVWDAATHGMMVLSIISSNIPGDFVGTAPKANYWLLRSENTASEYVIEEYNWVCAAEFADSVGVDIIHSSLGYAEFDDDQDYTYENMDGNTAISTIGSDIAASKGILLNTSAGNSGMGEWHYISAPGDADSCLTIGACWRGGKNAGFSSNGPSYDNRVKPDVTAKGVFTTVQSSDGGYGKSFGTSLSGPVIAGLAACLWQAFPEKSNMEIIEAIQKSADQYTEPDGKRGYGLPDFQKAYYYLQSH